MNKRIKSFKSSKAVIKKNKWEVKSNKKKKYYDHVVVVSIPIKERLNLFTRVQRFRNILKYKI